MANNKCRTGLRHPKGARERRYFEGRRRLLRDQRGESKERFTTSFTDTQAFASQAVMSIQHLGLPFEKVNPVGGAIAMGHPLGCTGARQIATAMSEAKREKKKIFVTSMCIGSGMVSRMLLCALVWSVLMGRAWRLCLSTSSSFVMARQRQSVV